MPFGYRVIFFKRGERKTLKQKIFLPLLIAVIFIQTSEAGNGWIQQLFPSGPYARAYFGMAHVPSLGLKGTSFIGGGIDQVGTAGNLSSTNLMYVDHDQDFIVPVSYLAQGWNGVTTCLSGSAPNLVCPANCGQTPQCSLDNVTTRSEMVYWEKDSSGNYLQNPVSSQRGLLFQFGGADSLSNSLNNSWTLDPWLINPPPVAQSYWNLLISQINPPAARVGHVMSYAPYDDFSDSNSARGNVVMRGGNVTTADIDSTSGQVYTYIAIWLGSATQKIIWTKKINCSASGDPGLLHESQMAWNSDRKTFVLKGGYRLNNGQFKTLSKDTFEWDGIYVNSNCQKTGSANQRIYTHWIKTNTTNSDNMGLATMVYDQSTKKMTIFSGSDANQTVNYASSNNKTNKYLDEGVVGNTNNSWFVVPSTFAGNKPMQRMAYGAVYVPAKKSIFMFGGVGGPAPVSVFGPLSGRRFRTEGHYYDAYSGHSIQVGQGCGQGPFGAPSIDALGAIGIGQNFDLIILNLDFTNNYPGNLLWGVSNPAIGLGFGCFQYSDAVLANTSFNTSYSQSVSINQSVPNTPSLVGSSTFYQGLVQEPTATPLGYSLTPGLQIIYGYK